MINIYILVEMEQQQTHESWSDGLHVYFFSSCSWKQEVRSSKSARKMKRATWKDEGPPERRCVYDARKRDV